jgi:hypothetical protein
MIELLFILCQREMEALLDSQDTAVEEHRHERERSSIRLGIVQLQPIFYLYATRKVLPCMLFKVIWF